ncbi:tyrosine-type recombinase/integrase [Levilactobacillus sp. HBUAS70063]|uniref:tyrosine-type recombinase/integrase n=1 Tax=Levilactobacillus sp. HBUAS70063 TaxID=3109359 RepID=UPI003132A6C0
MSRIVKNPCKGKQARPWRAEFTQGSGSHRMRICRVFDSKREAQGWLAETVATHARNQYFSRDMLLADYLKVWFALFKKGVAPATKATYTATRKHVQNYLPTLTLADLSRVVIQGYFNALGRNHSIETLRKDLVHLRTALADAVADGVIPHNPTQRIRLVANTKHTRGKDKKIMTKAQYQAVRDRLMNQELSTKQIPLIVLAVICQTGLRVGEALALREDDVDVSQRLLRVDESFDTCTRDLRPTKTANAVRDIPMTSQLVTMLTSWQKMHDEWLAKRGIANPKRLLFLMGNGELPRATSVNYYYHQLQKKLGFETFFSTHTLRHFLVSQMIQNPSITLTYVSRFLGHSSEAITQQYYLGLIPDEIEGQRSQVANVIAEI